jgi:hypothetical protein
MHSQQYDMWACLKMDKNGGIRTLHQNALKEFKRLLFIEKLMMNQWIEWGNLFSGKPKRSSKAASYLMQSSATRDDCGTAKSRLYEPDLKMRFFFKGTIHFNDDGSY